MLTYKDDFLTVPYDDADMHYIKKKHQYVLELDKATYETAINLSLIWGGNDNAIWYLQKVSDVLYTYVLRYKDSRYLTRMLYYMSHSKEMRRALFEIMIDVIEYNFEDGGFMIAYQTGVNLHEMKDIDIKIEMAVSRVADEMIKKFGLQQRFMNMSLNQFQKFDTFAELTAYLISEGYASEDDLEDLTETDEIPTNYKFRAFVNYKGEYVCENLVTFEDAMLTYGTAW